LLLEKRKDEERKQEITAMIITTKQNERREKKKTKQKQKQNCEISLLLAVIPAERKKERICVCVCVLACGIFSLYVVFFFNRSVNKDGFASHER